MTPVRRALPLRRASALAVVALIAGIVAPAVVGDAPSARAEDAFDRLLAPPEPADTTTGADGSSGDTPPAPPSPPPPAGRGDALDRAMQRDPDPPPPPPPTPEPSSEPPPARTEGERVIETDASDPTPGDIAGASDEGSGVATSRGDYPYTLPFMGNLAHERGIALPLPIGFSLVAQTQKEEIDVSELEVGLGGQPLVPSDFVKLRKVETTASSALARMDLWLLPFLNLYGVCGLTHASTDVSIEQPLLLDARITAQGPTYGFGATLAAGNEWAFVVLDANHTWTDLDILTRPQRTLVGALRVGHRFEIDPARGTRLALWVGGGFEDLLGKTVGKLRFSDVLPAGDPIVLNPDLESYLDTLSEEQRERLGELLGQLVVVGVGGDPSAAPVDFRLRVRPKERWNLLLGAQLELSPSVTFLAEGGLLGTRSSMVAIFSLRFAF